MRPMALNSSLSLYQAISPCQLAALIRADWRHIEPAQGGESFCCLKLNQRYAEMVARQWLVPHFGAGYVVRLQLPATALAAYQAETVSYDEHREYRIAIADLEQLSDTLQSPVELVSAFVSQHGYSVPTGGEVPRVLAGVSMS